MPQDEQLAQDVEEVLGAEPNDDPDWISDEQDNTLGQEGEAGVDDYELEMFLSTDGKHTVNMRVKNPKSRRIAVQKAMEMYDYILTRYGTKQAQAVKEYGRPVAVTPTPTQTSSQSGGYPPKIDPAACPTKHLHIKFAEVKKAGPNHGRWFKACQDCGNFLGWQ